EQVKNAASRLLNSKIRDLPVNRLLIQERIQVAQEVYLGLTIDRSARRTVVIASSEGGVEIEQLAAEKLERLVKEYVDPLAGLNQDQAEEVAAKIGLQGGEAEQFTDILQKMYRIFLRLDCELLETNPLALTKEGSIIPLDVRMIVDDNALFRHPELQKRTEDMTDLEIEAARKGLSFIQLDGDIGVIGNGAGLVMATLDMVTYFGGRPADFCDVGGGVEAEIVAEAVKLVLKQPEVRVLVLNILGGITRCGDVAKGLVDALSTASRTVPVAVRLSGTGEEEGRAILSRAGLRYTASMEEAVREALEAAQGG
ncbi:MAG: succinate--CoA ligase subunit beta, partial [Nitrososphaerales archaeon]